MADPDLTALDDGDLNWGAPLRAILLDNSRKADGRLPANVRTATSYTATTTDIATTIYRNLTVANTVTIPTGIAQAEDRLLVRQKGTGVTSIAEGSGMTLTAVGYAAATTSFPMAGQGAIVEIVFESSTAGYIDGGLA
jgi:hypothetical protein